LHKSIIEIEQLLYRCCHAVDQGHLDNIMSLFHPKATLIINWEENGKYFGYDEIYQWFHNYTQVMKSAVKYLRHKITCPLIEVEGDEATALSYLDVDAAMEDTGQVIITVCRYEDKLTKIDGQWYLMEKSIFMDDTYTITK